MFVQLKAKQIVVSDKSCLVLTAQRSVYSIGSSAGGDYEPVVRHTVFKEADCMHACELIALCSM